MRNPTKEELAKLMPAIRGLTRARAKMNIEATKLELALDELREACDVPPGIPLNEAAGFWFTGDGQSEPISRFVPEE